MLRVASRRDGLRSDMAVTCWCVLVGIIASGYGPSPAKRKSGALTRCFAPPSPASQERGFVLLGFAPPSPASQERGFEMLGSETLNCSALEPLSCAAGEGVG